MTEPLLPVELQIIACSALVAFCAWVLYLVRLQRLSLRDSLLWLLSSGIVLLFSVFPRLLRTLARAIGVQVPSNALFALAIFYLALNVLSLTIVLSNQISRARRMAQEHALLRAEVDELRVELRAAATRKG